jgi:hypothetical protein
MINNHEMMFAVVIGDRDYFVAVDKCGGGTFGTAYICEDWTWTLYSESEDELKSGELHACEPAHHWNIAERISGMILVGSISPSNVAEQVSNGVDLLDRFIPNWRKLIDTDELDLASVRWCILGQIFGGYSKGAEILRAFEGDDFDEESYGFCNDGNTSSISLTDEWKSRLSD